MTKEDASAADPRPDIGRSKKRFPTLSGYASLGPGAFHMRAKALPGLEMRAGAGRGKSGPAQG